MIKKGEITVSRLVFTLIIISLIYTISIDLLIASEEDDQKNESYNLGKNIEEFSEMAPSIQLQIVSTDERAEAFIAGLNQDKEGLSKLTKAWFENKKDGSAKISDEVKNILWKAMLNQDKGFALTFAKEALRRLKTIKPGYYKNDIENIDIDPAILDKLIWKDSRLGIEENGKLIGWLNFNDFPGNIKNIEIKEVEGKPRFFVTIGNNGKEVTASFSSGSIDSDNYIIKPDGGRFGSTPEFLKGIKWSQDANTIKFNVDYYDLEGKEKNLGIDYDKATKKITLTMDDVVIPIDPEKLRGESDESQKLRASLGQYFDIEKVEKLVDDINKLSDSISRIESNGDKGSFEDFLSKLPPELQGNAREEYEAFMNIKKPMNELLASIEERTRDYKLPKSNLLNIGLLSKGSTKGSVDFDFKITGNLEASVTGGSVLLSTNPEGGVGHIMKQNPDLQSNKATFKYNRVGEVTATKNAEGLIYTNQGKELFTFKSGNEFMGVTISRSMIDEILSSADPKDILRLAEYKTDILRNALLAQDPDKIAESIRKLNEIINNKNTDIEVRNRAQLAQDKLIEAFKSRINEAVQSVFTDSQRGSVTSTIDGNPNARTLVEQTQERLTQSLVSIVNEPANLKILTEYLQDKNSDVNKKALNELIRTKINSFATEYVDILSADIVSSISTRIGSIAPGVNGYTDPEKLRSQLTEIINKQDFVDYLTKESPQTSIEEINKRIRQFLKEKGYMEVEKERVIIADQITDMIQRTRDVVDDQRKNLLDNLKKDVLEKKQSQYESNLIIDTESGDLIYSGKQSVTVDAKMPLRFVSVRNDATDGSKFTLNSYGKLVASFEKDASGKDKTMIIRRGTGKAANIAEIRNENIPGQVLMSLSNGKSYSVVNPKNREELVNVVNKYGYLSVTGIPILGTMPILTHHVNLIRNRVIGDIGTDPNAEFSLTFIGSPQKSGLFSRIINKVVTKMIDKQMPTTQANIQKLYDSFDEDINAALKPLDESGLREVIRAGAVTGKDMVSLLDTEKIDVPQRLAVVDAINIAQMVGVKDNAQIKRELKPMLKFLADNSDKIKRGVTVKVKNDKLIISNDGYYSEFKPESEYQKAILRQIMRETAAWNDFIPSHISRTMQELKEQRGG